MKHTLGQILMDKSARLSVSQPHNHEGHTCELKIPREGKKEYL